MAQYHIHFIKDKNQQIAEVEDVVIEASCLALLQNELKEDKGNLKPIMPQCCIFCGMI